MKHFSIQLALLLVAGNLNLFAAGETPKRGGSARLGLDESGLPADARQLRIGDPAPDFSLKGVDGKTWSLADFQDARLLMVIFLSNHCPYSHAAETRLLPLAADMK